MKLKGDYKSDVQYSAGDVVRWTDGTAMMAKETVTGVPPTRTQEWERLPQYMWDMVSLILDSIDISKATLDSRISEDTIVLKGQGGTDDYLLTVDDSDDEPVLDIDKVEEAGS